MTVYELAPHAGWALIDDGLVVANGRWFGIVRGKAALELGDDLTACPGRVTSRPETEAVLEALATRGVIQRGASADRSRFPRGSFAPSGEATRRTAEGEILVLGKDALADEVAGLLQDELATVEITVARGPALTGFDCPRHRPPGPGRTCAVVVAGPDEAGELPRLNRCFQQAAHPWVLLDGRSLDAALAGPLFVPGRTGCLECHWLRRAGAGRSAVAYRDLLQHGFATGYGHWERHMAVGLVTALTLGWLLDADPWLPGASFEIGREGGPSLTRHVHQPVRGCSVCDTAGDAAVGIGACADGGETA